MNLFVSCDLNACREQKHRLKLTWSDKTPLKASLMCVTCSLEFGRNAYVAYGDASKSFGLWRRAAGSRSDFETLGNGTSQSDEARSL